MIPSLGTSRPAAFQQGVRQTPAARRHVKVSARGVSEEEDYYALLGLSKSATDKEIKASYRSLQMRHHPDKPEGSRDMSALLNVAHDTLMDRKRRLQYDGLRRSTGVSTGSGLQGGKEGMVGPMMERSVAVADLDIRVHSAEAAVDWLQQWGSTFAFGCEMPFPLPLQCDAVAHGVRIAFISVSQGTITSVGELLLEVDERVMLEDGIARVCVTRVAKNPERKLPGEGTVLKTLQHALRTKMNKQEGFQFGGIFAALASSGLGMLPLLNFGPQDTTYDAYQIPKRCGLSDPH